MGTARSKEKKTRIKKGNNREWIFDIKNNPGAIEKARVAQEIIDRIGLPKRPYKQDD